MSIEKEEAVRQLIQDVQTKMKNASSLSEIASLKNEYKRISRQIEALYSDTPQTNLNLNDEPA